MCVARARVYVCVVLYLFSYLQRLWSTTHTRKQTQTHIHTHIDATSLSGTSTSSATSTSITSPYFAQAPLAEPRGRPRSASDADLRKTKSIFLTKRTIAAIKSRYRPQGRILVRTRPRFVAADRVQKLRKNTFNPKYIILVLGAC